jgi:SNF2 family DNA or RNA helicase
MGEQAWTHFNKVIASISMAKRKSNAAIITEVAYDLVIVDEAHHLKNRKTAAWQFANSLRKKYIFLLTATPVQNNLEELYNLITLLKPGQLKTYNYFKKNFIGDRAGLEAKNVSRLRQLLGGVMIRNRRSDVDVRFTHRTAVTYTLDLLAPEQALYDAISRFIRRRYLSDSPGLSRLVLKSLQEEMGSSFRAVRATLRRMLEQPLSDEDRPVIQAYLGQADQILQQHVPETKALKLLSLIRAFGDKIIVFTKYRATLDYLADYLVGQGLPVAVFHGGLRRSEKEAQIRLFQETATVLLSTESGGEGRNLQFCHGLVNYDLPWNPMAIEQRIGRIHRVGQTRDVFVYNLAAAGTVEHYILDLLDRKINLFELVVGEVDMILGDIEEETDFAEQVMNAWIQSPDPAAMEAEMTRIADKLLENKRQYQRIKELDNHLFAEIGNPTANGGAR